ncbi:MAG: hypothetical protein HKN11_09575 [Rhizobiales bacterium]|nr:hypothetical protein [Hyphomicrobiales bacterium]
MNFAQLLRAARLAPVAIMALSVWTPAAGAGGTVASLDDAVAPGWSVVMQAKGDLNKDGLPDIAAAIEADAAGGRANTCTDGEAGSNEHERELLVLLQQPDGTYEIAVKDYKVLARRGQGGANEPDPLSGLSIDRGSLVVAISYGGGGHWGGETARFRLNPSGWEMIGYTWQSLDTRQGPELTYDYDPLTAKMQMTVNPEGLKAKTRYCVRCRVDKNCPAKGDCQKGYKSQKTGETSYRVDKKPLVKLADFRCWQETIGLFTHTGFTR